MSDIDSYRENLREAQRALEIAQTVKDEYKSRDLIVWGTTQRGFTGWLVKGKKADEVYAGWQRARSEVDHWGNLIAELLKQPALPIETHRAPPMTPEEIQQRKEELAAQVAARLGEKLDPEPTADPPPF